MLSTDLLAGRFRALETVRRDATGEWVRVSGEAGEPELVFLAASAEFARLEVEHLRFLACPGVPRPAERGQDAADSLLVPLEGLGHAVTLASAGRVPRPVAQAILGRMLSVLSHIHSRGLVHGAISPDVIFVDPGGDSWMVGWAAARPAQDAPGDPSLLSDVQADLRDLGRAVYASLMDTPPGEEPPEPVAHSGSAVPSIPGIERDFARVLGRLLCRDARAAYLSAAGVLLDLGLPDESLPDAWAQVPFLGRGTLPRLLGDLLGPDPVREDGSPRPSMVEFVGGPGSGRTRLLSEIARDLRPQGVVVLSARGDDPGALGGVGSLLRQAFQVADREAVSRIDRIEDLRRLVQAPGAAAGAAAPLPGALPRPELTAAATELVRVAFEHQPGALLLDDADALQPTAAHLWKSIGAFLQSLQASSMRVAACLASTRAARSPVVPGIQCEAHELDDWSLEEVREFLGCVVSGPDIDDRFAAELHRVVGGRPAEIVGFLRHLEERGVLGREGTRWTVRGPLPETATAWAGAARELTSRGLEACGPDGRQVVEAIAAGGTTLLRREDLARLAEVSGPRLIAACDAAQRSGLIRRLGSGWRVRTEAIRQRILARIPDPRRQMLHREILVALLAAPTPDSAEVADHARACGDPEASRWTLRAVAKLRSARRYDDAIDQMQSARSRFRGPFWSVRARILLAELHQLSGRLGAAIAELDAYTADPQAEPHHCARALLALAEALYDAREWDRVTELPLPLRGGSPQILCHLRLIRAAALAHLHLFPDSEREERLAWAELGDGGRSGGISLAANEFAYVLRAQTRDLPAALPYLLKKVRLARRLGKIARLARDLGKLGNLVRCLGSHKLALAILARSDQIAAAVPQLRDVTFASNSVARSLIARHDNSTTAASAMAPLRAAVRCAQRSGLVDLAETYQFRILALRALQRQTSVADLDCLTQSELNVSSWSRSHLIARVPHLASAAMLEDSPILLAAMSDAVSVASIHAEVRDVVVAARVLALIRRNEVPAIVFRTAGVVHASLNDLAWKLRDWLYDSAADDPRSERPIQRYRSDVLSVLAWALRCPDFNLGDVEASVSMAEIVDAACTAPLSWGAVDISLALALWAPIPYSKSLWDTLAERVRAAPRPFPPALEWQRLEFESRSARMRSQLSVSIQLHEAAILATGLLAGAGAARSFARALLRTGAPMTEYQVTRAEEPEFSTRTSLIAGAEAATTLVPFSWERVRRSVSELGGIVVSAHLAELELFAEWGYKCRRLPDGGLEPVHLIERSGSRLRVAVAPNMWDQERVTRELPKLQAAAAAGEIVLGLVTEDRDSIRRRGSAWSALLEPFEGPNERLPGLLTTPDDRVRCFRALCANGEGELVPASNALAEVALHPWAGGLAEMRGLVRTVARLNLRDIDDNALRRAGWRPAAEPTHTLDRMVFAVCCLHGGPVGLKRILSRCGGTRRSVQRSLARLVAAGALRRLGLGPATVYEAASGVQPIGGSSGIQAD